MNNNNLITQLNYIKTLLEENRLGDANDMLSSLNNEIHTKCIKTANELNNNELLINKTQLNTKPNNSIYINGQWVKLININKNELEIQISNNIKIKTKYKIQE